MDIEKEKEDLEKDNIYFLKNKKKYKTIWSNNAITEISISIITLLLIAFITIILILCKISYQVSLWFGKFEQQFINTLFVILFIIIGSGIRTVTTKLFRHYYSNYITKGKDFNGKIFPWLIDVCIRTSILDCVKIFVVGNNYIRFNSFLTLIILIISSVLGAIVTSSIKLTNIYEYLPSSVAGLKMCNNSDSNICWTGKTPPISTHASLIGLGLLGKKVPHVVKWENNGNTISAEVTLGLTLNFNNNIINTSYIYEINDGIISKINLTCSSTSAYIVPVDNLSNPTSNIKIKDIQKLWKNNRTLISIMVDPSYEFAILSGIIAPYNYISSSYITSGYPCNSEIIKRDVTDISFAVLLEDKNNWDRTTIYNTYSNNTATYYHDCTNSSNKSTCAINNYQVWPYSCNMFTTLHKSNYKLSFNSKGRIIFSESPDITHDINCDAKLHDNINTASQGADDILGIHGSIIDRFQLLDTFDIDSVGGTISSKNKTNFQHIMGIYLQSSSSLLSSVSGLSYSESNKDIIKVGIPKQILLVYTRLIIIMLVIFIFITIETVYLIIILLNKKYFISEDELCSAWIMKTTKFHDNLNIEIENNNIKLVEYTSLLFNMKYDKENNIFKRYIKNN